MKKKILLDIDVVAVAEHFTKDNDHPIAKPFIERVKTGEFENYTTYALLDLVEKWKDERIAKKVLNIYRTYTYIIPASEIELKGRERKIVFEKLVEKIFKRDMNSCSKDARRQGKKLPQKLQKSGNRRFPGSNLFF